jgi:hypothetical protein
MQSQVNGDKTVLRAPNSERSIHILRVAQSTRSNRVGGPPTQYLKMTEDSPLKHCFF